MSATATPTTTIKKLFSQERFKDGKEDNNHSIKLCFSSFIPEGYSGANMIKKQIMQLHCKASKT